MASPSRRNQLRLKTIYRQSKTKRIWGCWLPVANAVWLMTHSLEIKITHPRWEENKDIKLFLRSVWIKRARLHNLHLRALKILVHEKAVQQQRLLMNLSGWQSRVWKVKHSFYFFQAKGVYVIQTTLKKIPVTSWAVAGFEINYEALHSYRHCSNENGI